MIPLPLNAAPFSVSVTEIGVKNALTEPVGLKLGEPMGWKTRSDWQMAGDGGAGPCLPGRLLLEFQQVRGTEGGSFHAGSGRNSLFQGLPSCLFRTKLPSGSSLSRLVSNQRPNSHDFCLATFSLGIFFATLTLLPYCCFCCCSSSSHTDRKKKADNR